MPLSIAALKAQTEKMTPLSDSQLAEIDDHLTSAEFGIGAGMLRRPEVLNLARHCRTLRNNAEGICALVNAKDELIAAAETLEKVRKFCEEQRDYHQAVVDNPRLTKGYRDEAHAMVGAFKQVLRKLGASDADAKGE